jgi:hypothetical protein
MSGIVTIILFFVAIVLAAVVFSGWVVFVALRAALGGLISVFMPGRRTSAGLAAKQTLHCPQQGCHATNPNDARFCRRCGRGLPAAHRVQVRRAAVW